MSAIVDHLNGVKFLAGSAIGPELLNPWTPRDQTLVKGQSAREKKKGKKEKKRTSLNRKLRPSPVSINASHWPPTPSALYVAENDQLREAKLLKTLEVD